MTLIAEIINVAVAAVSVEATTIGIGSAIMRNFECQFKAGVPLSETLAFSCAVSAHGKVIASISAQGEENTMCEVTLTLPVTVRAGL